MNNYQALYQQAVAKIPYLPSGSEFRLRDLIDNPPASLGIYLYRDVGAGNIPGVKYLGFSITSNLYMKK